MIAQCLGLRLHFWGAEFESQHAPLTFLSYMRFRPLKITCFNGEGKHREETCMTKSSPLCSQRHVESTNPHWASIVDYGLSHSYCGKRSLPCIGPERGSYDDADDNQYA
ncbi:jg15581 [Pararge aegeria aegeria]|uniref:Jg15581 protein n=1 Tax=Pararge aegeria aegeria TaxID=348720 RepID=A0A8S4RUT5_9NEOP|nr:jg15581 [Pararge aegeria aegeria]